MLQHLSVSGPRLRAGRCLSALLASAMATAPMAAPGDIDPGFGFQGKLLVDSGLGNSRINAATSLPDGRIVLAGVTDDAIADDACVVAMLMPDGSLDGSFGNGGRVILDFNPDLANVCEALAVQPDGRIVLAGYRGVGPVGNRDFMVIRLLADGSLDSSFSNDGYAFVSFNLALGSVNQAKAVALQADGKVVVAGWFRQDPGDHDVAVARLNPDGSPDNSFGSNGRATLGIDGSGARVDEAHAVAVQDDGRIVLAGISQAANSRMLVARLTADGLSDSSFNLVGYRLVDFGLVTHTLASSLVVRDDGTLLLGGYISDGAVSDFAIAAVQPDGQIETGFGVNGRVTVDFFPGGDTQDGALAMTLDTAGRVLLGGVTIDDNGSDMAALRLLPDGNPDAGFGDGGRVVIPFDLTAPPYAEDVAYTVHAMADGGILLAGGATLSSMPAIVTSGAVVKLEGGPAPDDVLFASGFELVP